MSSPTLLVTAATGQLGKLVVEHLLSIGVGPRSLAVAVRSPDKVPKTWTDEGISVRAVDYSDSASKWAKALEGIQRFLLISSSANGQERLDQHQNILDGVKEAGSVNFITYTSILYADKHLTGLGDNHLATEGMIRKLGIPFVFLRNGFYTENWLRYGPLWKKDSVHHSSAGDAKFATASRQDFAEAAALVLAGKYKDDEEVLELAGDDYWTFNTLLPVVSAKLGKTVEYKPEPEPDYAEYLKTAGYPEPVAKLLANADTNALQKGSLFNESKTLSRVIGRPTTPWAETIKAGL